MFERLGNAHFVQSLDDLLSLLYLITRSWLKLCLENNGYSIITFNLSNIEEFVTPVCGSCCFWAASTHPSAYHYYFAHGSLASSYLSKPFEV